MSLLLQYRFDGDTSSLGQDSSGNSIDLTNFGVVSATDPLNTFGNVAKFDASSSLDLSSSSIPAAMLGTSPRSFSFWIYSDQTVNSTVFSSGQNVSGSKFRCIWVTNTRTFNTDAGPIGVGALPIPASTWGHVVITFGSSTFRIYINGVVDVDNSPHNLNTTSGDFSIGRDPSNNNLNRLDGLLQDFRVYDDALDAAAVSTLYADGPLDVFKLTLEATVFTHLADVVWSNIPDATNYTLTQEESGSGSEVAVLENSTDLSITIYTLVPNTSYDFRLYTDLDMTTPSLTLTEVTPVVDTTSVSSLATRLSNDFTTLVNFNEGEIQSFLSGIFNTGDIVTFVSGKYVFAGESEILNFILENDITGILTPFENSAGSGQTFTLDSDSVNYDESSNEITINGSTIASGGTIVVNGYKVTMKDLSL